MSYKNPISLRDKTMKPDDFFGLGVDVEDGVVPGCVVDGALMLWENHSVAAAVLARSFLNALYEFVFFQKSFLHEWTPYGRCGAHQTIKNQVVTMHAFFVVITFCKQNGLSGPSICWTYLRISFSAVLETCL